MTTSSNKTLADILEKNDFSKIAAEAKRQQEATLKKTENNLNAVVQETQAIEKTADELKALAYKEGVEAGRQQMQEELSTEFEQLFHAIRTQIESIEPLLTEKMAQTQQKTITLLQQIVKHALSHASQHYSEEILETSLKQALSYIHKESPLIVRIAPSGLNFIEKQAKHILKGLDVTFKEDATLEASDCIIEWDNSGVDARFSNVIKELDKIVEGAAQGIKPEDVDLSFLQADTQPSKDTTEASTEAQLKTQTPQEDEDSTIDQQEKPIEEETEATIKK